MKIVISSSYNGFRLNPDLVKELVDNGSSLIRIKEWDKLENYKYNSIIEGERVFYIDKNDKAIRINKQFVDIVKKYGENAGYEKGGIKIINIPDYKDWEIVENYGMEIVRAGGKEWY